VRTLAFSKSPPRKPLLNETTLNDNRFEFINYNSEFLSKNKNISTPSFSRFTRRSSKVNQLFSPRNLCQGDYEVNDSYKKLQKVVPCLVNLKSHSKRFEDTKSPCPDYEFDNLYFAGI
jgi:hypothetical protein